MKLEEYLGLFLFYPYIWMIYWILKLKKKILLIKEKSFRKIENVCKGFNIDRKR